MNDPLPRTVALTAGVLVAGGIAVFFSPRSVLVSLQWTLAGLGLVAAFHVAAYNAPTTWWTSPFDGSADGSGDAVDTVDEAAWIRARFGGRRVTLGDGRWAMPPEVLRLLRPLIVEALERMSLDSSASVHRSSASSGLSPLTLAVLRSDPTIQPGWWSTTRGDERQVAGLVNRILDDLERLETSPSSRRLHTHEHSTNS